MSSRSERVRDHRDGIAGPTRRTGSLLLLMKVSSVHRDSVANICLRIQRGRAARGGAIRIDGRKVVPTKGGRDPIEIRGGPTWRAIIINEGPADIYTYISRTPAGILTTVP